MMNSTYIAMSRVYALQVRMEKVRMKVAKQNKKKKAHIQKNPSFIMALSVSVRNMAPTIFKKTLGPLTYWANLYLRERLLGCFTFKIEGHLWNVSCSHKIQQDTLNPIQRLLVE